MTSSGGFTMPSAPSAPFSNNQNSILPTSTVEISVRCTDLADKDILSKSDPLCVMFMKRQGNWFEMGRTEMIKDTLNPAFEKKFVVDYSFEERQLVKFELYDWDMQSTYLADHDFLGRCETSLGSIVSSGHLVSVLKDTSASGSKIFILAEELKTSKEAITMQFRAEKLDKKDFFGKSDPFFVISKGSQGQHWSVVKRSEVIMKNLNPTWAPFEISAKLLCNGDHDRPLKVDVYDWDSDGGHDYIGSFTTSLSKLQVASIEQTGIPCINEEKKRKKGNSYKNSGTIFVKHFKIETQPTFVEYLQGGVTMNFSVAIDFTASNGDPRQQTSLHYMNPVFSQENQYTTAIRSVGEIIQDYDTDKQFPALGFGAQIPPTGQTSHEFFLNLRTDSPFCSGVDGLLSAYWNAVQCVRLYGPTYFAPVINHVANFARAYQNGDQYFVLLIITDGIITDMEATKCAIINACELPMSIIIVGVGYEDFSAMEELDGDKKRLSVGGRTASRDIVQFVEFHRFIGPNKVPDKAMLAKEVLAEIPQQFVGWMKARHIYPKTLTTTTANNC